jgi:2-(3-amino-3-carboxypropyl)histidine synthase
MSQIKNGQEIEGGYDYELPRVVKEIKKSKAGLVGLQFPEGLKTHAVDVARRIEEGTGAKTVTFIGPVYGACDTKEREAEMLGVDLVIHFGHTAMKPVLSK